MQVRVSSDELDRHLKKEISAFKDALRKASGPTTGQVRLKWFQVFMHFQYLCLFVEYCSFYIYLAIIKETFIFVLY